MDNLIKILKSIRSDIDFNAQTKLIDDGILDSFDIVSIVGELNEEYDIEISIDDMTAENFNSASSMYAMVERLQNED